MHVMNFYDKLLNWLENVKISNEIIQKKIVIVVVVVVSLQVHIECELVFVLQPKSALKIIIMKTFCMLAIRFLKVLKQVQWHTKVNMLGTLQNDETLLII